MLARKTDTSYEPPLEWWRDPVIVGSAESETEDGGTGTHEPSSSENRDGDIKAIEDSEPEEWDQNPEFAEYAATLREPIWRND